MSEMFDSIGEFSEFESNLGEDLNYSHISREFDSRHNLDYPILRDSKNFSTNACAIYLKMMSYPENFHFSIKRLAKQFKNGEKSIRSGLKELKESGYLYVERIKLENGRGSSCEYKLYLTPEENPHFKEMEKKKV